MFEATEPPVLGSPARLAADLAADELAAEQEKDGVDGEPRAEDTEVAGGLSIRQWTEFAQRAHQTGKDWFEASISAQVAAGYAHFQSRHAPGSKYYHEYYKLRSQVFRPKSRSLVRRGEAATAVAFFSTEDLLTTDSWDDANPDQADAAEVAKYLIQYRLERTLPWFQTLIGAAQEAYVTGRPIAHLHWKYRTRLTEQLVEDEDGNLTREEVEEVITDRPAVDLVPIENLILDPACDWRDPINSSPYLIFRMPMYVGDVKAMIEEKNAEYEGLWYFENVTDASWWTFSGNDHDSVRTSRQTGQADVYDARKGAPDLEIVWIHRVFMRVKGIDYVYDMIDTRAMLSVPRPVSEVYPHLDEDGMSRPFVMGTCAIEAHKAYPTAPVMMVAETQKELNELANLRIDGIRNATLGRWLARRGGSIDIETLKYGVANSVITTEDVTRDLRELKQQDLPASVFAEADRVNVEFDELAGNFSAASVGTNRQLNETVGGMNLLSGDADKVKELEIRTFTETFVEPLINQLYALEQMYETDEQLLNDVVVRSGLSLERVLDLLALKVRVRTSVGMGATSPEKRIARISMGVTTVAQLAPEQAPGVNGGEIVKEVFGALGFRNGSRFYNTGKEGGDPEKEALQQRVAQLEQLLAGRQLEAQSRVEVANIQAQARLQQAAMDGETRERIALLDAQLRAKTLQLEEIDRALAMEQSEVKKRELILQREALSHEIQQDNREFLLAIDNNAREAAAQTGGEGGRSDGPMDLPGDDNAGTLARGRFNLVPFAEG